MLSLFYAIIVFVCELVMAIAIGMMILFSGTISVSLTDIVGVFPMVITLNEIIISLAVGIWIVGILWAGYSLMMKPINEKTESLASILFNSILYGIAIFAIQPLADGLYSMMQISFEKISSVASLAIEEDVGSALQSALVGAIGTFLGGPVVAVYYFLVAILLLLLLMNYVPLIISVFEKYLIVAVLNFLSPLVMALGVNKSTRKTVTSWFSFYFTELILLILSAYLIAISTSGILNFPTLSSSISSFGIMTWFMCNFALLKVAINIEKIMGGLGLKSASTGGDFFRDLLGMSVLSTAILGMAKGLSPSAIRARIAKKNSNVDGGKMLKEKGLKNIIDNIKTRKENFENGMCNVKILGGILRSKGLSLAQGKIDGGKSAVGEQVKAKATAAEKDLMSKIEKSPSTKAFVVGAMAAAKSAGKNFTLQGKMNYIKAHLSRNANASKLNALNIDGEATINNEQIKAMYEELGFKTPPTREELKKALRKAKSTNNKANIKTAGKLLGALGTRKAFVNDDVNDAIKDMMAGGLSEEDALKLLLSGKATPYMIRNKGIYVKDMNHQNQLTGSGKELAEELKMRVDRKNIGTIAKSKAAAQTEIDMFESHDVAGLAELTHSRNVAKGKVNKAGFGAVSARFMGLDIETSGDNIPETVATVGGLQYNKLTCKSAKKMTAAMAINLGNNDVTIDSMSTNSFGATTYSGIRVNPKTGESERVFLTGASFIDNKGNMMSGTKREMRTGFRVESEASYLKHCDYSSGMNMENKGGPTGNIYVANMNNKTLEREEHLDRAASMAKFKADEYGVHVISRSISHEDLKSRQLLENGKPKYRNGFPVTMENLTPADLNSDGTCKYETIDTSRLLKNNSGEILYADKARTVLLDPGNIPRENINSDDGHVFGYTVSKVEVQYARKDVSNGLYTESGQILLGPGPDHEILTEEQIKKMSPKNEPITGFIATIDENNNTIYTKTTINTPLSVMASKFEIDKNAHPVEIGTTEFGDKIFAVQDVHGAEVKMVKTTSKIQTVAEGPGGKMEIVEQIVPTTMPVNEYDKLNESFYSSQSIMGGHANVLRGSSSGNSGDVAIFSDSVRIITGKPNAEVKVLSGNGYGNLGEDSVLVSVTTTTKGKDGVEKIHEDIQLMTFGSGVSDVKCYTADATTAVFSKDIMTTLCMSESGTSLQKIINESNCSSFISVSDVISTGTDSTGGRIAVADNTYIEFNDMSITESVPTLISNIHPGAVRIKFSGTGFSEETGGEVVSENKDYYALATCEDGENYEILGTIHEENVFDEYASVEHGKTYEEIKDACVACVASCDEDRMEKLISMISTYEYPRFDAGKRNGIIEVVSESFADALGKDCGGYTVDAMDYISSGAYEKSDYIIPSWLGNNFMEKVSNYVIEQAITNSIHHNADESQNEDVAIRSFKRVNTTVEGKVYDGYYVTYSLNGVNDKFTFISNNDQNIPTKRTEHGHISREALAIFKGLK